MPSRTLVRAAGCRCAWSRWSHGALTPPAPARICDHPITEREGHRPPPETGRGPPGVADGGRDRPVTTVTRVTAGTSANRSTATVLADDLVGELAGRHDPEAAAAVAAARNSVVGAPAGNAVVAPPEPAAPDAAGVPNPQVAALAPAGAPRPGTAAADPVQVT